MTPRAAKTRSLAIALLLLCSEAAAAAERDDLAARMAKAENASEYWDLMARFESGHRLVARFLVTNEGPGRHTAVAVGHLVFPDGSHADFHNGRPRARWKLDDSRLRLDIGSSTLDLGSPERAYEVDKNKAGVKIHLSIRASDANSLAPKRGPGGYRVRLVDLAAPIEGSVWIRDRMAEPQPVRGVASLTHTWMDESEPEVALRRIDFASLDGNTGISLVDLKTPGGPPLRWIAIQREGQILYESGDFEVSLSGTAPKGKSRDYPVPARLRFHNSELSGTVELERILLKKDPMKVLPQPFRFLLSLKMKPRRIWADSPFELKFGPPSDRSAFQARGTGMASVTFLNPFRSS